MGSHAGVALVFSVRVSIHNNALPDGVNPFRNWGTSVYYYHPQSLLLAQSIHRRLLKALKLWDFGLFYDNLALCRPTQMPAVLVEPTFIMHPEEEALLRDPKFQNKIARAIVKGIEDFFKQARED
jgi:N-acetylmuramoyl-L-alanine amidase